MDAYSKRKKVELMELVEHYLSMLIILEFNKLIADLQKQKKVQKQKKQSHFGNKNTNNYPQR